MLRQPQFPSHPCSLSLRCSSTSLATLPRPALFPQQVFCLLKKPILCFFPEPRLGKSHLRTGFVSGRHSKELVGYAVAQQAVKALL